MNSKVLGAVLFVLLGIVRMPMEDGLAASLRARGLQQPQAEVSWQENFGQMFMATLGGLRSLVASITYLQSYAAWEDLDWGKVDSLMTLTTRLQPREESYWDHASWQMAYNAASSFRNDTTLRYAIKHKRFRDHVQRGIAILNEGLRYLPNNPRLLVQLGDIYVDRMPEPRLAAEAFLKAHANGASNFYERRGAYELVKLDDRASWERAYEILKRYYDQGKPFNAMASIQRDLPVLEERLGIPLERRIRRRPEAPLSPGLAPK